MNTAQGSCGQLQRATNMELELLESQLFPLLTVSRYEDKAEKKMATQGVTSCHLLLRSESLSLLLL